MWLLSQFYKENDKIMIDSFYNNKESNYIKLDCYRDEAGKYFWK